MAIFHIHKAYEKTPEDGKIFNILSSIYKDAELYEHAIEWCTKSIELDKENFMSYLQLAECYINNHEYVKARDTSLYILSQRPKLSAAFILYIESQLFINDWDNDEYNRENIVRLCDHYMQINNRSNNISPVVSEFVINSLNMKFFISECFSYKEIQNANYLNDEEVLSEINNFEYTVGLFAEQVDEYVYSIFYKIKELCKYRIYIISYEETEYSQYTSDSFIVVLNKEENPWEKAKALRSLNLDILFFFEALSLNRFNNINLRMIYQCLSFRPASRQVVIPYSNLTKGDKIFDYIILDKFNYKEDYRNLYKEKIILMTDSSSYIENREFYINVELDKETYNVFPNDLIIYANFSPCYKISRKIFDTWLDILIANPSSVLLLNMSNEEQIEVLKQYISRLIDPNRLMFVKITNRLDILGYLNYIDFYLDIHSFNGDDELFLCQLTKTPFISINKIDELEPVSNPFSQSIFNCLNIPEDIIFHDLACYKDYAIRYFRSDSDLYIKRKSIVGLNDKNPLVSNLSNIIDCICKQMQNEIKEDILIK